VPSDGGFLVPPTFAAEIKDLMAGASDSLLDRTDNYTVEAVTGQLNSDGDPVNGVVAWSSDESDHDAA
jgi:hypothetical protein